MRLPIEWIREHVDIDPGPEEIADRLTMAGLEVEEKAESAIGPVLDIKVTPNRGDCLSVTGVARELRAAYGVPEKEHAEGGAEGSPADGDPSTAVSRIAAVTIEAPDACARYAARVVRNLKMGPSPKWMQDRIAAAGMRPINNIVDVTNYVMLETGQPLHAFDYDRLSEHKIVVRRAAVGETLTTLDGQIRLLDPSMLVIADAARPVALAGVMGGGETEMSEQTTTLLLESAHFDPLAVRRTAKALDMRTEASYRFERYVDPCNVVKAADRACELIAQNGMGEVVPGAVDVIARQPEVRSLVLRPDRVTKLLGYEVAPGDIVVTLRRLGFVMIDPEGNEAITWVVPTWRPDIVREIDLVEEVGRVLGYERIPETLPHGSSQGGDSTESQFVERVRSLLVGAGLQEIVSHSLLASGPWEVSHGGNLRVPIRSALSAELSGLRQSLLPGLIDALERNARRGQSPLAFFEIGHTFHRIHGEYDERPAVGGVIAGPIASGFWQRDGHFVASDFYSARGLVEILAEALHLTGLQFTTSSDPRLHPGRAADVLLDGNVVGHVGELHPRFSEDLTVRQCVVAFELQVAPLMSAEVRGREFQRLTPFPSLVRDLAPRVGRDITYRTIERAVESAEVDFLERLTLTDLFTGAPLPEGMKSYTLSLTFRASDRTLTDEEVNSALSRIRRVLERDCGAAFVA